MTWHTPRTWNVGELVTKTMLDEQIRDNMNYLFSAAWPVGSIYISTVSTNPATLFGFGTWVAKGEGRVLVGVGTSDAVYAAAATGGESNHTLTSNEMPVHHHDTIDYYNPVYHIPTGTATYVGDYTTTTPRKNTSDTGGGAAHNNMPPYLVVYMWERTV